MFCILTLFFAFFLFITRPSFSDEGGWAATYGGETLDNACSLCETSDGGYVVAGWTGPLGARRADAWVLELRQDGTIEWQKTYGGVDSFHSAESIHKTSEGGCIVAGYTRPFGAGKSDLWVLKLKTDGTIEWQKTYGGVDKDLAESIQQTRDGGYIVAGVTNSFGAEKSDFWVLKLRPDGAVEWQKTYGGDLDASASSIMQTRDGGYVVAGWIGDPRTSNLDFFDFLVLKLRPDGSISPSCNLVKDTILVVEDTSLIVESTSISPIDSNATPKDSSATAQDTNALAKFLCP